MTDAKNLFDEFSPVSKEKWLEKIIKDLKGKPLADLSWQLEEHLSIAAFYHPDDEVGDTKIQRGRSANNDWKVGEDFFVGDPVLANKKLLDALSNGVNAPRFLFENIPSSETFRLLLQNVIPDYIQTHFKISGITTDYISLAKNYHAYLQSKNINPAELSGSFQYTPPINESPEKLIATCNHLFPTFKCLYLNSGKKSNIDSRIVEGLAGFVRDADQLLQQLDANQVQLIELNITVGTSYFVEIARIRALRILWANLLKAYGVSDLPLIIDAYFNEQSYGDDVNTNMIRSMAIAMSAVIGGVNRLTILPADREDSTFSNRIARNVQHLLKMESYMDRVIDPAAGSFYIEKLTKLFAERAWEEFRKESAPG
ncbi:MAG: methylmalonyl-CoA mutase [Saprospiraceae bacterium]|jgi:methylmalonyl-CoA mutase